MSTNRIVDNRQDTDKKAPNALGDSVHARHYFSGRTIRLANAYRDIHWNRLAVQGGVALMLMAAATLPDLGNLSILLLIAGAALAAGTVYTCIVKFVDAARRH